MSRRASSQPVVARDAAELAELLGVSQRTVRRWVGEGAPRRDDRTFDVEAVRQWRWSRSAVTMDRTDERALIEKVGPTPEAQRSERTTPRRSGRSGQPPDELRALRVANLALKNRARRADLERMRADLVPVADVAGMLAQRRAWWSRHLSIVARLVAPSVAATTDAVEIEATIRQQTDALLARVAHAPRRDRDARLARGRRGRPATSPLIDVRVGRSENADACLLSPSPILPCPTCRCCVRGAPSS